MCLEVGRSVKWRQNRATPYACKCPPSLCFWTVSSWDSFLLMHIHKFGFVLLSPTAYILNESYPLPFIVEDMSLPLVTTRLGSPGVHCQGISSKRYLIMCSLKMKFEMTASRPSRFSAHVRVGPVAQVQGLQPISSQPTTPSPTDHKLLNSSFFFLFWTTSHPRRSYIP